MTPVPAVVFHFDAPGECDLPWRYDCRDSSVVPSILRRSNHRPDKDSHNTAVRQLRVLALRFDFQSEHSDWQLQARLEPIGVMFIRPLLCEQTSSGNRADSAVSSSPGASRIIRTDQIDDSCNSQHRIRRRKQLNRRAPVPAEMQVDTTDRCCRASQSLSYSVLR